MRKKLFDTADILREAMFRQLIGNLAVVHFDIHTAGAGVRPVGDCGYGRQDTQGRNANSRHANVWALQQVWEAIQNAA